MDSHEKVREHCNKCVNSTWHNILHAHATRWEDNVAPGYMLFGGDTWRMIKCCGCDSIRLKHSSWCSEDTNPETGEYILQEVLYPPNNKRSEPIWRRQVFPLSSDLQDLTPLHSEIVAALSSGAFRIAVMGMRALAERVMRDVVGEKGSFAEYTRCFFDAGYLSEIDRRMFEDVLIEAGHAAMHRDFEPTATIANDLLDFLEMTMTRVYRQGHIADRATKQIPPGRTSKKKSKAP